MAASSFRGYVFVVQEHQVSQEQEVVAAFFQLVDSLLRAAPGVLLPAEQLPTFMTWACASLRVCPLGCTAAAPRAALLDP